MCQHEFAHVLPRYAYDLRHIGKPYQVRRRFNEAGAWNNPANIIQCALDSLFR